MSIVAMFSSFYPFANVAAVDETAAYPSGKHTATYPCFPGVACEYQLYVDYPWYSDYFYQQESTTGVVQEKVYNGAAYAKANCLEQESTGGSISVSYSYSLSKVSTEAAEIATKLNIKGGDITTSLGTKSSWSTSSSTSTTIQLSGSYDWGTIGANTKKWITPYVYIRETTGAKYAYNELDAHLYNWTYRFYCGSSFKVNDIYSKTTEAISYPVEIGVEEKSARNCSSVPSFNQSDRSIIGIALPKTFVNGKNWSQPMFSW
ncbi:MAG: hypothetical protein LBJ00_02660 [Planctomycetaceae bacterium]|nr:hypothetical protein [Planctomycetaceae bacterium]